MLLVVAVASADHRGDVMNYAEEPKQTSGDETNQTRYVELPWADAEDEIVADLAIDRLREELMTWLETERGIHPQTLLVSVGALAGFAAQNAALERVANRDIPLPPGADPMEQEDLGHYLRTSGLLMVATAKSGEKFYFGDLINGYLVQQTTSDYPLWSIVAAVAVEAGVAADELPDYMALFGHAADSIGTPEFGVLQVDEAHQPQITPREALDMFWPRTRLILMRTDGAGLAKGRSLKSEHWPLVIALVAGQLVTLTKDTLDPRIGVGLLMEAAITMSKVDPKEVPVTPAG
jgi:hypothetical protein